MGFVQIIEYRTSRFDDIKALAEKWLEATEGRRTMQRELVCANRDEPAHYVDVVEFESYESAMQNSELPETHEIATQMQALCEGPMRFLNLDVVATF